MPVFNDQVYWPPKDCANRGKSARMISSMFVALHSGSWPSVPNGNCGSETG